MMEKTTAAVLQAEIEWLKNIIVRRLNIALDKPYTDNGNAERKKHSHVDDLLPPVLDDDESEYAALVKSRDLSVENRLLLIMGIVHHVLPAFYDRLIIAHPDYAAAQKEPVRYKTRFNELGGISSDNFRGFIPTGLTWLYLLAGDNLERRIELMTTMNKNNPLLADKIILFPPVKEFEPVMSAPIAVAHDWLRHLIVGDLQVEEKEIA